MAPILKKTNPETNLKRPAQNSSAPKRTTGTTKTTSTSKSPTKKKTPVTIQDYVELFAMEKGLSFDTTQQKGIAFEKFIFDLFKSKGYKIKEAETPTSGDHGVDLVISKKKSVRSDSWFDDTEDIIINYMVQCKYKSSGSIGEPIIRDLIGATSMYSRYKNKVGMCITTTTFTVEAKKMAKHAKVELFDGEKLLDMLKNKNKGLVNVKKKTDDDWFF